MHFRQSHWKKLVRGAIILIKRFGEGDVPGGPKKLALKI